MPPHVNKMPKKFKGENSKATAAKERKSALREERDAVKRADKEKTVDASWKEGSNRRKAKKKEDGAVKRAEKDARRAAVSAQEKEESLEADRIVRGKKTKNADLRPKVPSNMLQCLLEKSSSKKEQPVGNGKMVQEDLLQPNVNKRFDLDEEKPDGNGEFEARSVNDALDLLSVGKAKEIDKHPEKRMKAAYAAYRAKHYDALKADHSSLKRSQLMQMLQKQWKKSEENPMNQNLE